MTVQVRDSRRTSLLLAAAAALILIHFFPAFAAPVAWLTLAVGVVWIALAASRLVAYYRAQSLRAKQHAADEIEFQSYKIELDALRAQHDPDDAWNESTDYPRAYRESLSNLHERHRAMLERRFGPG